MRGEAKGDVFRVILALEKRRARIAGEAERMGPLQLVWTGLGLSLGMVSLALIAWLLVLPIALRPARFALAVSALVACGVLASLLVHLGRPRLTPAAAAELESLDEQIRQAKESYARMEAAAAATGSGFPGGPGREDSGASPPPPGSY
jgi:hypothetical protein